MIRFAPILFALTLVSTPAFAYESPIAPPDLVQGQYVYTIPEGFEPSGLSKAQQEQLNGELKKLHNPFYVVILKDLPLLGEDAQKYGRTNGFRGTRETLRIEISTAMLIEDWAKGQSGYNTGNTSVFVIAFEPRKFAWHPGLNWGLRGAAQDPFTKQFTSVARTRPADYGRGIANLALALDTFVFDRTDPTRMAQLAQAAEARVQAERLQRAQGALNKEVVRMVGLLQKNPVFLPKDLSPYKKALSEAQQIQESGDPTGIQIEAKKLREYVNSLQEIHDQAAMDSFKSFLLKALLYLTGLILFILGIYGLCRRWGTYRKHQQNWWRAESLWNIKLQDAEDQWTNLYLERDDLIGLEGTTGETQNLWDKVTKDVDYVHICIQAMKRHKANCEETFRKGGFFRLEPLCKAWDDLLHGDFEFDTGEVNPADLFSSGKGTILVSPERFARITRECFQDSYNNWKLLQSAAEARRGSAATDFPHANLDDLFERAHKARIPDSWLETHPLFGDDESDQTFYDMMDTLRETDPVKYQAKLFRVKTDESHLDQVITSLEEALGKVDTAAQKSHSAAAQFANPNTNMSTEDDPQVALAQAVRSEQKLYGLLALKDRGAVLAQAQETVGLYSKCLQLQGEIQAAVRNAERTIEGVQALVKTVRDQYQVAVAAIQAAAQLHSNTRVIRSTMDAAQRYLSEGDNVVAEAQTLLNQNKHLDACRKTEKARQSYLQAQQLCQSMVSEIEHLETDRKGYLKKLKGMPSVRTSFQRKMNTFGPQQRHLDPFNPPKAASGPQDYAALLQGLVQTETLWRKTVRCAEDDYESNKREQRRAREERERREREDREAQRRRQSSYSSSYSSSSSSSSFGGGGFGGSGGGFGGGGFGGSSGSF